MYGLIGYPLGHSFSKTYFTEKFLKEDIDEKYELFPLPSISELSTILSIEDLKGFNVTIPYKEDIIEYLSRLSSDAERIGAVNVVKRVIDGNDQRLIGYNTDWKGFRDSLISLGGYEGYKALILGTGGASRAVRYALETLQIPYQLVSRDSKRGDLTYSDLTEEIIRAHKLIINTTPLGTFPNSESYPPIPYQYLTPQHICHDLVYNPEVTQFMKNSEQYGARVKNGLEMLHRQADYAWEIWRNY